MSIAAVEPQSSTSGRILRFGPFAFHAETGELTKHGYRIRLCGQPVRVLAMLLERPGEVITREDLQKRLWPDGTYVDFEHSINAAVRRLRQALSDSADSPRFIETLARTGYRFIAPVTLHLSEPPPPAAATPDVPESVAQTTPAGIQRKFHRLPALLAAIVAITLTVGALTVLHRRHTRTSTAPIRCLAVLPLTNASGDPEQEYFVEGIADMLRQDLEAISALRVISRTSSMHYRAGGKPLSEIAREMNVDAVVEGSVLRAGNRLRINIELVRAADDTRLWGGTYERRLEDVFALQSELAQTVADRIRVTLTRPERDRLARTHTADPEAYLAYSKGRFFWNKRTETGLRTAIGYFQQAIERDPNYALAYDGLADCWAPLAWYGYVRPDEAFPRAKAAVLKALALDNSLAEAQTTLAFVTFYYDRDWVNAEREFRHAIDLNPNYANGHHWYAEFLTLAGMHSQAIAESEHARELDPLSPIINTWVGSRYFFAQQYDRAIKQYQHAIQMDPTFVPAHLVLGHALEQKGRYGEAILEFEQAVRLSGGSPVYLASLGHAYGAAGRRSESRKVLDQLRNLSARTYVSSYDLALAYLGAGATDLALTLLARAIDERCPRATFLRLDPRFDCLRSDPRFQALALRVSPPSLTEFRGP